MPLIEQTIVKDGDEVVTESERKLYALGELKALTEEGSEEIESRAYENALEKLAEFAMSDTWWTEGVLDNDAVELFKAVGITVPPKTEVVSVKVDGKFQYDEHDKPITKTVTREDDIWEEWDVDHSSFVLNRRAVVDEKAFLRALKWYLAGKDIRTLPELQWGGESLERRPLRAGARQQRNFDLRSKDARIIREQGLAIQRVNGLYGGMTREFDIDYNYEGLSDQTMENCNELLSDLCHEVVFLLRDEMEYRTSEEALLEDAEANDMRFDKTGRPA